MASALDLVAAIGQTFGDRGRSGPSGAEAAGCGIHALCWRAVGACLWRGGLRWVGACATRGAVLRSTSQRRHLSRLSMAICGRSMSATATHWTLLAAAAARPTRAIRLGAMLGLSPPAIERLAPPESCSDTVCPWRHRSRPIFLARNRDGSAPRACVATRLSSRNAEAPPDYVGRCQPRASDHAGDIAEHRRRDRSRRRRWVRTSRAPGQRVHPAVRGRLRSQCGEDD